MSARAHVEVSTTAGMIGFHDSAPTLNRVLAEVRVGDRVYVYVTCEMRLAAQAQARVAREVFGIQAPFSRRSAWRDLWPPDRH
jgi:hypothetical protein